MVTKTPDPPNGILRTVAAFVIGAGVIAGGAAIVQVNVLAGSFDDHKVADYHKGADDRIRQIEALMILHQSSRENLERSLGRIERKIDAMLVKEGMRPSRFISPLPDETDDVP